MTFHATVFEVQEFERVFTEAQGSNSSLSHLNRGFCNSRLATHFCNADSREFGSLSSVHWLGWIIELLETILSSNAKRRAYRFTETVRPRRTTSISAACARGTCEGAFLFSRRLASNGLRKSSGARIRNTKGRNTRFAEYAILRICTRVERHELAGRLVKLGYSSCTVRNCKQTEANYSRERAGEKRRIR